eukprot:TRINITY_DN19237_c0_g1_i1.p1 TRINITY_DN19237_c0_g1~~TRINITY_DN19237_c0_g1_i1.p1  ORF type:complete len:363 (+),score=46.45 TRINITY_DN19237_c0_g1_i1:143-1231(+)
MGQTIGSLTGDAVLQYTTPDEAGKIVDGLAYKDAHGVAMKRTGPFVGYGVGYGSLSSARFKTQRQGLVANLRTLQEEGELSQLLVLALLPWLCFAVIMGTFTFLTWTLPLLPWTLVLVSICVSIDLVAQSFSPLTGKGLYWRCLGTLCIAASLLGLMMGLYDHDKYLSSYALYQAAPSVSGVLPQMDPARFKDAGIMRFGEGSYVDASMSIGYTADSDIRYCVAPVLGKGTSDAKGTSIGFWAVGIDCCDPRGAFACGPIWNRTVTSGLSILQPGTLGGEDLEDVAMLRLAVREAAALNSLTPAADPVFVRWAQDPEQEVEAFWTNAMFFYWWTVIVYLGAVIAMGSTAAAYWQNLTQGGYL